VRAPSNSNIQPWHTVFASGPARDRLVTALLGEAIRKPPKTPPLPQAFAHLRRELGAQVYGSMGIARKDTEARWGVAVRNWEFFRAPLAGIVCIHRDLGPVNCSFTRGTRPSRCPTARETTTRRASASPGRTSTPRRTYPPRATESNEKENAVNVRDAFYEVLRTNGLTTMVSGLEWVPTPSAMLVVKRGPNAGSRFRLDQPVTSVGRHLGSHIFLDDITVSRRHAEFRWERGEFRVVDVGSLNGTYVNGEPIDSAVLTNGDEIHMGKFRLVFLTGPAKG
jgi:FHA domain